MMLLGKRRSEMTSRALAPRVLLKATLLSCCRLRGVSEERQTNTRCLIFAKTLALLKKRAIRVTTRTFIELEAEVRGRSHAGVVDGLLVEVVSSKQVSPELNKQLYQISVLGFGCVMKSRLVELGSIHVCSLE